MKILLATALLSAVPALAANIYDFSVLPSGGKIHGVPGSTIGWGYALQNQSSSLWLVPTSLNAGTFTNGTPTLLFDFPALAPDTSVTQDFDAATSSGLYQLTWNTSAPLGFTNAGTFTLGAQWWSGDPTAGGMLVFNAPSAGASYRATVATTAVPEPGTLGLTAVIGLGLLAASARRVVRLRRGRCRRSS